MKKLTLIVGTNEPHFPFQSLAAALRTVAVELSRKGNEKPEFPIEAKFSMGGQGWSVVKAYFTIEEIDADWQSLANSHNEKI
jgi:hypothetical protein